MRINVRSMGIGNLLVSPSLFYSIIIRPTPSFLVYTLVVVSIVIVSLANPAGCELLLSITSCITAEYVGITYNVYSGCATGGERAKTTPRKTDPS